MDKHAFLCKKSETIELTLNNILNIICNIPFYTELYMIFLIQELSFSSLTLVTNRNNFGPLQNVPTIVCS